MNKQLKETIILSAVFAVFICCNGNKGNTSAQNDKADFRKRTFFASLDPISDIAVSLLTEKEWTYANYSRIPDTLIEQKKTIQGYHFRDTSVSKRTTLYFKPDGELEQTNPYQKGKWIIQDKKLLIISFEPEDTSFFGLNGPYTIRFADRDKMFLFQGQYYTDSNEVSNTYFFTR